MSTITANVASSLTSAYGSGIDTTTLINGLVAAESQPITGLQTQQSNITDATSQLSAFSADLSTLQTAAQSLSTPLGFNSMAATSSDSSVVANAIGTSSAGSYTVNVLAVAQQQRTYSNPQTSSTDALGMSGTLSLTVGTGSPISVNVSSTDSLADIATNISASGAGVTANVVFDGSNYRLMIRGQNTGAANSVTFGESGFSLGLSTAANTVQKAQDASVQMDGITFTRPSNQISGVIPGVTLAVTQPNVTTNIQVATSTNNLESQIGSFVQAYNAIVTADHTSTGYGSTAATNPLLGADHAMRSAVSTLQGLMASTVPGTSGSYTTLGSVGIDVQQDGTLSFDTGAFETAMAANPSGVSALFVTDPTTGSTGVMQSFVNSLNTMTAAGTSGVAAEIASYGTRSTAITNQISTLQLQVASYQAQLTAQFIAMNTTVASYKTEMSTLTSFSQQMAADEGQTTSSS